MPIALPKSKVEVERTVVERFIASMNRRLAKNGEQFFLSDPRQNAENDFDFTVTSPKGDAFLELMEIAPLMGPYDKAPPRYNVHEFAESIFRGILEKSQRYPERMEKELFLLCYVTHWTFILSRSAIACLRYWCARTPLAFRAVFSFQPLDDEDGEPTWLFPVPPNMLGDFDPEMIRNSTCLNLDSRKFEVQQGAISNRSPSQPT
jgi:hypothetical protein